MTATRPSPTHASGPPRRVDRLIVHQFDPARPSPGGIDTCLRGICRYFPRGMTLAVVGVDTGHGPQGRQLGRWEQHQLAPGRTFWFLPVAAVDPANQVRRIPHSLRIVAGLARFRRVIPEADVLQVHRMDTAAALRVVKPTRQAYFVHTQQDGLTGKTSDSWWRHLGDAHRWLEQAVMRRAESVVVFNEAYGQVAQQHNPRAIFSPTWYDPQLMPDESAPRDPHRVLWVGRLEVPKDPQLAVRAAVELIRQQPSVPWSLDLVGSGTLLATVQAEVAALPDDIGGRIRVRGRLQPTEVAAAMAAAGVFLMTSHPGYEGFPRVLVESMASGLPAVVTLGSDTGGLVVEGRTGFVCDRNPGELARWIRQAQAVDRSEVRRAVRSLDAPNLVARLFALDPPSEALLEATA